MLACGFIISIIIQQQIFYFGDIWYINSTQIWYEYWLIGINGTTQPYGFIYHDNTKFVHVDKTVATKYIVLCTWILKKYIMHFVIYFLFSFDI